MYFSKESRYRNLHQTTGYRRREGIPPGYLVIGGLALLLVCCACAGIAVGLKLTPKTINNPLSSLGSSSGQSPSKATATPSLKGDVPLKSKGASDNGLELTVTAFQRPLEVQNLTKLAADQQFVLVSVSVKNTKSSGDPIAVQPAQFKIKGEGGLEYLANPKSVTIENLMAAEDTVAPGKTLERELIYQIAKDDSGLKMYWTAGKTTRTFVLETK